MTLTGNNHAANDAWLHVRCTRWTRIVATAQLMAPVSLMALPDGLELACLAMICFALPCCALYLVAAHIMRSGRIAGVVLAEALAFIQISIFACSMLAVVFVAELATLMSALLLAALCTVILALLRTLSRVPSDGMPAAPGFDVVVADQQTVALNSESEPRELKR